MKAYLYLISSSWLLLGTGCVATQPLAAESPVPVVAAPPAQTVVASSLDELMAPIALYPDALVALILPAATASSDVVLAARYLDAGGDPNQLDNQPWDDSVKALAHYPDVIKWMDENLAWTQRVGAAYLDQPQDVMAAVQHGRARARANGLLVDTPQQHVVVEDDYIRIIPAQPNVIYVPRYDPEIIYVDRPVYFAEPWLTFGIGFGVGSWLAYDCDWHTRTIWVDHRRHDSWRDRHDWRHPNFPRNPGYAHDPGWRHWTPAPGRHPRYNQFNRPGREMVRVTPMPGAPRPNRGGVQGHRDDDRRRDNHGRATDADQLRRPQPGAWRPQPVPGDRSIRRDGRSAGSPAAPHVQTVPPAQRAQDRARNRERSADTEPFRRRAPAMNQPGTAVPQTMTPQLPRPTVAAPRGSRDNAGARDNDQRHGWGRFEQQTRTNNRPATAAPTRVMPAAPAVTAAPRAFTPPPNRGHQPAAVSAAPAARPVQAPAVVRSQPVQNNTMRPSPRVERSESRSGGRDGRRSDPDR